jgi:hypothetical protein
MCTCVEIKFRAPYAIDATFSPRPRRLDGVEAHEGFHTDAHDFVARELRFTQIARRDIIDRTKEAL